jgi:hypothetical protein
VIDGDRAAFEEDVEPDRRRQGAMVRRHVRLRGDRLAQQPDGFVVVEVVAEIRRPVAQLARGLRARQRRKRHQPERHKRRQDLSMRRHAI